MKLVAALIVRNEGPVLRRCLDSLRPHVDHIIVNDNGSTDDTPQILEEYGCIQVPGEWVDFAWNRNLVLNVARKWGDYVLCGIDADEVLVSPVDLRTLLDNPDVDAYSVELRLEQLRYPRTAIVKSTTPWAWRGVLQEGLYCDGYATHTETLPGVRIDSFRDGARACDPTTGIKDLEVLKAAVEAEPTNTRYVFYLAQQYKDVKDLANAAKYYNIRILLGGWWEEVWASRYMLARIKDWQGLDPVADYLEVHEQNPFRAEALYYAGDWCRRQGKNNQALIYADLASQIPMPENQSLFMDASIYDWRALDLVASVAWYTPYKHLGKDAAIQLVKQNVYPEPDRPRIESNHAVYTRM